MFTYVCPTCKAVWNALLSSSYCPNCKHVNTNVAWEKTLKIRLVYQSDQWYLETKTDKGTSIYRSADKPTAKELEYLLKDWLDKNLPE